MTEQESNHYQEMKEKIAKCIDHNFVLPKNIPYPFERSVLIKELDQVEVKTQGGIIMGAGRKAENVLRPNIGVIVATGPKVPDYLVPKLRVYFNQNIDLEYLIGGEYYKMSDFMDIYAAIPENTFVSMDTKDEKEMTREGLMERQEGYNEKSIIRDLNELDEKELKKKLSKSKNFIIPKGDA